MLSSKKIKALAISKSAGVTAKSSAPLTERGDIENAAEVGFLADLIQHNRGTDVLGLDTGSSQDFLLVREPGSRSMLLNQLCCTACWYEGSLWRLSHDEPAGNANDHRDAALCVNVRNVKASGLNNVPIQNRFYVRVS